MNAEESAEITHEPGMHEVIRDALLPNGWRSDDYIDHLVGLAFVNLRRHPRLALMELRWAVALLARQIRVRAATCKAERPSGDKA
jgi:hypothetical protein